MSGDIWEQKDGLASTVTSKFAKGGADGILVK
jgi:hypothetical protein